MEIESVHIIVSGKVQGVFFRASTKEKALEFNLKGWVKNLSNGNVEITASGKKENLNKLIEWCKIGSKGAIVDKVNTEHISNNNSFTDFQIKY